MFTSIAAYHFVAIDDPEAVAARVRAWAEQESLLGTVLVAGEGINLFLAGADAGIAAFLALLRGDARFAGIFAKHSRSATAPFARLKVKVKPEIISFRRDGASPLEGRAPAVAPADLARWIARGSDDEGRRLVDNFTELPEALQPHRETLADATVVGFCTGGIRCEKAVNWMRSEGFDHALQLDGGILGYFEAVGGAGYDGRCFVFDERIALDPRLRPLSDEASAPA